MAWQQYPVSLRAWKKWMSRFSGTSFPSGRFASDVSICPELAQVLGEHGWPPGTVFAVRGGWIEGAWIDRHHNFQAARCSDKDLGEWVQVVSIDGKPWWGDIARRARQVLATLRHWLTVLALCLLGLLISLVDNMLFE